MRSWRKHAKQQKKTLFISTSALLKKLDLTTILGLLIDRKKENGSPTVGRE